MGFCKFEFPDGGFCNRVSKKGCCFFHKHKNPNSRAFLNRINRLIAVKDGDWRGFSFPNVKLVEKIKFDFEINLSWATLGSIHLDDVVFEKKIFAKSAVFSGSVRIHNGFFEFVGFEGCCFEDDFQFTSVTVNGYFNLPKSVFKKRFELRGRLCEQANFNEAHFLSATTFSFHRPVKMSVNCNESTSSSTKANVLLSTSRKGNLSATFAYLKEIFFISEKIINKRFLTLKAYLNAKGENARARLVKVRKKFKYEEIGVDESPLFEKVVTFNNVVFDKPKMVLFNHVDLRNASFSSTDLKGVLFVGCNWFQTKLGRNGVREEVSLDSKDYHSRRLFLPIVESTSRSVRSALEESKDFALANDFFIGEMEAKRKQMSFFKRNFFSLLAWYNAISKYGTSPTRCLLFILVVAFVHSLLIFSSLEISICGLVYRNLVGYSNLGWISLVQESAVLFGKSLVNSLQVMTLQKERMFTLNEVPAWINFANFLASLVGPVLTLFLGLSVRTRIKRS